MSVDTEPLDLADPAWLDDPYPAYARMRADGGLHRSQRWDTWFASGHDLCHAVFADDRFDAAGQPMLRMLQAELLRGATSWQAPVFPSAGRGGDGLRAAGRRTTGRALGTAFVDGLWPRFEQACADAAETVTGTTDLVGDYAIPLTTGLLADLMAVGDAELPAFRAFAESGYSTQDDATARRVVRDIRQVLAEQVVDRVKRPVDDFVGHLTANPRTFPGADSGGGHLEYVLGTGLMISLVTHQGLVLSFSTLMRALLDHPDQYALLRAEPGLVAGAVEEGLRFDSSTQALGRRAKEAVDLAGTTIPAGSLVVCLVGSANRDEGQWPDGERFDVTRDPRAAARHLTFGHGSTSCLGAAMSRRALTLMLAALVRRVAEVAPADGAVRFPEFVTRGHTSLPAEVR